MVMENEIRLGDIMDKLTPSDRVVIYNAARQVVYRGYAANAVHGTLNPQRRIKKMGLGYREVCQFLNDKCGMNIGIPDIEEGYYQKRAQAYEEKNGGDAR